MIEKLTVEQEVLKKQWAAEWFKIGSSTEPADRARAELGIGGIYELLKKGRPSFYWVASPFSAKAFLTQCGKETSIRNYTFGQENAYWVGFHFFCREVLGVKYNPSTLRQLDFWNNISRSCGWWWPFERAVIVSDRPEFISWNSQRVLHNASGPSVRFRDGWSIWSLNGIPMRQWHVETPAEKIIPRAVLEEKDVDVRRELIRKVGIERLLDNLTHKVIDSMGDYTLLSIDLSDDLKDCRYLKMKNPSLNVWHLEGVERTEPATVQAALDWRAQRILESGKTWKPQKLT